jgi:hypothetical protein
MKITPHSWGSHGDFKQEKIKSSTIIAPLNLLLAFWVFFPLGL